MNPKRLGTDARQDQIAEAALAIVNLKGIRSLNVAAVANKFGIVPSAVYRHFKNKMWVIAAVLELIRVRLTANFESINKSGYDPLEKLQLLLNWHTELIHKNHAIPRIIFSEEVIGEHLEKQKKLFNIIQGILEQIAAIVREGQKSGQIRTDVPPENLAVMYLGIIQPA